MLSQTLATLGFRKFRAQQLDFVQFCGGISERAAGKFVISLRNA